MKGLIDRKMGGELVFSDKKLETQIVLEHFSSAPQESKVINLDENNRIDNNGVGLLTSNENNRIDNNGTFCTGFL